MRACDILQGRVRDLLQGRPGLVASTGWKGRRQPILAALRKAFLSGCAIVVIGISTGADVQAGERRIGSYTLTDSILRAVSNEESRRQRRIFALEQSVGQQLSLSALDAIDREFEVREARLRRGDFGALNGRDFDAYERHREDEEETILRRNFERHERYRDKYGQSSSAPMQAPSERYWYAPNVGSSGSSFDAPGFWDSVNSLQQQSGHRR